MTYILYIVQLWKQNLKTMARRKKEKTVEKIEEEISFITSIKNMVNDYDHRVKEIYRLYRQAKENKLKKVSWVTLVRSQGPDIDEVSESDWKRFVSLYHSYKKREKLLEVTYRANKKTEATARKTEKGLVKSKQYVLFDPQPIMHIEPNKGWMTAPDGDWPLGYPIKS